MNDGDNEEDISRSAALLEKFKSRPLDIDLSFSSLKRVHMLLDKLGSPHQNLPPVVHIAGTNGKGSTLAALRAMAEADGKIVHAFTSPFLVRFHEQIRLAGQLISEDQLVECLERVWAASKDMPVTYFEATTIAAFLAFSEVKADLCLLETGLGGRLDATNVVPRPLLHIITPISYDHQEFLGDTLDLIAREKAGIFRRAGKAIIAPQVPAARRELVMAAKELSVDLNLAERDWRFRPKDADHFLYEDRQGAILLPKPPLPGVHQISNAATAVAAARQLGPLSLSTAAIRAGLEWIRWPGRLQDLSDTPLLTGFPEGSEIWLDGGHNGAAGQMLANFIRDNNEAQRLATLIIGMKADKDAETFLAHFVGLAEKVIAIPVVEDGKSIGIAPADLASLASDMGLQGLLAKDLGAALERARTDYREGHPAPFLLLTGSLRLAGEALSLAGQAPR